MVIDQLVLQVLLLDMLRKYHNVTTIGFYVVKRIRRWETEMIFQTSTYGKDYAKRDQINLQKRSKW